MDQEVSGSAPLENLYQALVECFGVIICGYVAGRLGIVTEQQSSGLSTFVATFSLPSLIFLQLATLDLSSVSWYLLLSVFLAKAFVFSAVLLITLLITRPVDPARAGLYAIFCTQSNDFALGFPIVVSTYGRSHPELVSYLWLLAPISLIILNPVGFVLMELGKRKAHPASSPLQLASAVLTSIATNPIVFMTALGMVGNLLFNHTLPLTLYSLLNVLGSAFTATALFLLGLRMVGNVRNFKGAALLAPALLIATKELALPLVIRQISSSVLHWANVNTSASTELSTFGFLYGTFPAAPGVFVYATTYSLEVDLIAGAMVACTFFSAPLMFISAKMISVSSMSGKDFLPSLKIFEFDVSIAGLICAVLLLIIFSLKRNFLKFPQRITMLILFSQVLSCAGVLISGLNSLGMSYLKFSLTKFGDFSTQMWTPCLAISLALIEAKSFTCLLKLQPIFIGIAWLLPIMMIGGLLLGSPSLAPPDELPEKYFYGTPEAAVSVFILLVSLIVSVVYMIVQQRYRRRYARYLVYSREASDNYEGTVQSSEDILATPQPRDEDQLLRLQSPLGADTDDSQPIHHIVLLFSLLTSIFISLSVSIWRLVMEAVTPVYVELSFLDVALTRAQSIIILFIFGLDAISFIQPSFKRLVDSFSREGAGPGRLPSLEEVPSETQHLCDQFLTYHLEPSKTQILRRRRVRLWEFGLCFSGQDLVSWLLEQGLVKDREEGVVYGGHLLRGGVLRAPVCSAPLASFTDDPALYVFTN